MSESRLFKILYYLLDKGQATAPELAQEFEVSVRTIYRDIDMISSAGIGIYTTTGRNGGIKLTDGYVLNKSFLTKKEMQEILFSLQSLATTNYSLNKDTLSKLQALFQNKNDNWIEIDYSRWGSIKHDHDKFELLKQAIINYKEMIIQYVNSKGEFNTYTIQPLKLIYKSLAWYVQAYCIEKQAFRIYKINRIIKLQLTDNSFESKPVPVIEEAKLSYPKTILKFPQKMAYRIYDEFDNNLIDRQGDNFIVTACLPQDDWLIGYILSFGDNIEIIDPNSLKEKIKNLAEMIYLKNSS